MRQVRGIVQDGYDLVLTIDETVQHILEKYLDEGVVNNQVANRATGIIMNVKPGKSWPWQFPGIPIPNNPFTISDPTVQAAIDAITDEEKKSKALGDARTAQWRNKAISDTYYPGSECLKMVTLSMALEENSSTKLHVYLYRIIYPVPRGKADSLLETGWSWLTKYCGSNL